MKFVRFFAAMFALTLLAATTAQAMTVQEFFSKKDENIRLVQHVLEKSQTTGVRKQLDDTRQLLVIAEKETVPGKKAGAAKLAWFFALHIDYQAGTTLPEAEAAPFQKEAELAGFKAAQILQIARQELGALSEGTFRFFGEVAAMGQAAQAGQGQKADPPKATPGDSNAAKFEAIFLESKAKVQKATGRPFPIDTNDRSIINALIRAQEANPLKIDDVKSGDQLRIISASIKNSTENLKSMGFSLEATLLYTLDNIEKSGYGYWAALHKHRRLDLLMPYFSIYENPEYIKSLLENGVISKQVARRLIDFRHIFNELYGTKF